MANSDVDKKPGVKLFCADVIYGCPLTVNAARRGNEASGSTKHAPSLPPSLPRARHLVLSEREAALFADRVLTPSTATLP